MAPKKSPSSIHMNPQKEKKIYKPEKLRQGPEEDGNSLIVCLLISPKTREASYTNK
jgi:hypothetical protein